MTARRIVIIQHDFFRGGTERAAVRFAKEWTDAGRDVTILCGSLEGGLRDLVDPRVPVVVLDPPVPRSALSRWRLGRAMAARLPALRPDLIFLPGNFHLPLARALRAGVPHAAIAQKISNPPLPGGIARLFAKLVFRFFAKGVDGFAAMNEGLAREVAALAPEKPVIMLRPPFEIGAALPRQARPDGPCRIFWAGRLEPQKDAGLALATIQALNKILPAHLTMLGAGALQDEVERQIAAMELGEQVTCLSHVPDITPCYAEADALLITSRYEGGPAVAIEALAQGTPVVSTDCSHLLHEILTIAEAGIIVPSRVPEDLAAALAQVCRAPRPPLERLRALATPFKPDVSARAFLDWFDSLAAHG